MINLDRREMKVSIFNPMKYQVSGLPNGWPTPPGYWDPRPASDR